MPDKCDLGDNIAKDSPQDASATPSKHPKIEKKPRKRKVFQCLSLSSHAAKTDQRCSQNHSRSSQVESKIAILPLSWPILKVSWPILVATCRQLCPSFANLRPNFARICHHMPPCTQRSAPRAPKILPALSSSRFSTSPKLCL